MGRKASRDADRGEGDVENIEDVAEGAVVAGERLTLYHVDDEVEEYNEAKSALPQMGCQKLLHTKLPEHTGVRNVLAQSGISGHLCSLDKCVMRHSLDCDLGSFLNLCDPFIAAL